MYTNEDLKDLSKYLRVVEKENREENPEGADACQDLRKQLEVIGYEAFMFEGVFQRNDLDKSILKDPLEKLPLRMDERDLLPRSLISWRLERGV